MNNDSVPAPTRDIRNFKSDGLPLFSLGVVVATPGALELLQRHGVNAATLLRRHQCGDWGDLTARDRAANDMAVRDGSRILSAYVIVGEKVWVITEDASDDGISRTSTCVLMAGEY